MLPLLQVKSNLTREVASLEGNSLLVLTVCEAYFVVSQNNLYFT